MSKSSALDHQEAAAPVVGEAPTSTESGEAAPADSD
jgi:hypothetical protein